MGWYWGPKYAPSCSNPCPGAELGQFLGHHVFNFLDTNRQEFGFFEQSNSRNRAQITRKPASGAGIRGISPIASSWHEFCGF